jgi:hypothetical protein
MLKLELKKLNSFEPFDTFKPFAIELWKINNGLV